MSFRNYCYFIFARPTVLPTSFRMIDRLVHWLVIVVDVEDHSLCPCTVTAWLTARIVLHAALCALEEITTRSSTSGSQHFFVPTILTRRNFRFHDTAHSALDSERGEVDRSVRLTAVFVFFSVDNFSSQNSAPIFAKY